MLCMKKPPLGGCRENNGCITCYIAHCYGFLRFALRRFVSKTLPPRPESPGWVFDLSTRQRVSCKLSDSQVLHYTLLGAGMQTKRVLRTSFSVLRNSMYGHVTLSFVC